MIQTKLFMLVLVVGIALGAGGVYVATRNQANLALAPSEEISAGEMVSDKANSEVSSGERTEPSATNVDVKASAQVVINGVALNEAQLGTLKNLYGKAPVPGNYWYDSRSGLQGAVGQGTAVQLAPGLNFGTLRRDASAGNTGVLVNGRELPQTELAFLANLIGQVNPGSYWLDANGNMGVEGNNTPAINLATVIQTRGSASVSGGGDNFWSSGQYSAGNSNADNSQGYVSVPGVGPVGYGF